MTTNSKRPTDMKPWTELTPTERNDLIGDSLGFTPTTQCFIGYCGEKLCSTIYTEKQLAEANEQLRKMQTAELWPIFKKKFTCFSPEMRGHLEIIVDRWHIRYSDTPGGGWCVVEWLNAKGDVDVLSEGKGQWRVVFDDRNPHHGKISIQAPTMAEAACLVSLEFLALS